MFRTVSRMSGQPDIIEVLRGAMDGKTNNTGTVTLRASETTTTIADARIGTGSVILLMPLSATAAAAMDAVYVSARGKQTATLTHDSDAATDRAFAYAVIG